MTTAVERQSDRPATKTLLPIKIKAGLFNGYPNVTLEYEGDGPGGIRQPYERMVGPPLNGKKDGCFRDPLGVAVIQVMQMFWDLEAEQDKIAKERDEAVQRASELAADLVEARQKIHGLESRLKDVTAKNGGRK